MNIIALISWIIYVHLWSLRPCIWSLYRWEDQAVMSLLRIAWKEKQTSIGPCKGSSISSQSTAMPLTKSSQIQVKCRIPFSKPGRKKKWWWNIHFKYFFLLGEFKETSSKSFFFWAYYFNKKKCSTGFCY